MDIPGLAGANGVLATILRPEASMVHRQLHVVNAAGYAPTTRRQIEAGFQVPASDYIEAMRARDRLRAAVEAAMCEVDALVAPAVPFVAPSEDPAPTQGGADEDDEMLASGFANLTGHPSLSMPCGQAEGLPVGLQFTGGLGADAGLLALAGLVEGCLAVPSRTIT